MSSRIFMEPELVRQLARALRNILAQMDDAVTRLGRAAHLSSYWMGSAAYRFEQDLQALQARLRRTVQDGDHLVRLLENELREWVQSTAEMSIVFPFTPFYSWSSSFMAVPLVARIGQILDNPTIFTMGVQPLSPEAVARMTWNTLFEIEESLRLQLYQIEKTLLQIAKEEQQIQTQLQSLSEQIQDLKSKKETLLKEIERLEAERDEFFNRILPKLPLRKGFDDGLLDMPWYTRSDELEDRIAEYRKQLAHLDEKLNKMLTERQELAEQLTKIQSHRDNLLRTKKQATQNLALIHEHLDRGITDSPTRRDLITSKQYGLAGCTNYVAKKRDVTAFPNSSGQPGHPGHAYQWDDQAVRAGYEVGTRPIKGSIMVFEKGILGVNTKAGHVAYVESVERTSDGGYLIKTSEANTLYKTVFENGKEKRVAIRGTHGKPYMRYYYMKRMPDGTFQVWRWDPTHQKPRGTPILLKEPHRTITFIYDKR